MLHSCLRVSSGGATAAAYVRPPLLTAGGHDRLMYAFCCRCSCTTHRCAALRRRVGRRMGSWPARAPAGGPRRRGRPRLSLQQRCHRAWPPRPCRATRPEPKCRNQLLRGAADAAEQTALWPSTPARQTSSGLRRLALRSASRGRPQPTHRTEYDLITPRCHPTPRLRARAARSPEAVDGRRGDLGTRDTADSRGAVPSEIG